MKGNARSMSLLKPATWTQALRLYWRNPTAIPLAGGTDFMVAWNMGLLNNKTILDLSRLDELKRITMSSTGIQIGALATHTQIQQNTVIQKKFPLLAQAAATIGAWQIQNRATLGGNIANASPAGDSFPPLAVYQARVNIVSAQKTRAVDFLNIFAGVKKTTLQPGELISSIELKFTKPATKEFFRKVGTRQAQAISKISAAGILWLDQDGFISDLRFALGSVAPAVRRLKTAEKFCLGKKLSATLAGQACDLVSQDIAPIDDIRSTKQYRLQVSKNLLKFFLIGEYSCSI